MGKIDSRTGTIRASAEKVFELFSDLRNFESFIPRDKVKVISTTPESCTFELGGIGKFGLRISEKVPCKLVKIESFGDTPLHLNLFINIVQLDTDNCLLKVSIDPDVNPFIMAMIKIPLQNLADTMIDQMERYQFK
jgi:ribosome-associated toxin RatA of RatAB toxin-antitoxin module